MKRSFIADAITLFFALLFLYTGLMKLMDIHSVQQQLSSSGFTHGLAGIITWVLPIGEILLAITLLTPKFRLQGLYISTLLMSIFTVYVIIIALLDTHPACSCGGIIEDLSPQLHILFNTACVLLGLLGISIARRQKPSTQFKWLTGSSSAGLLIVVGWLLSTAFRAPGITRTGMEGQPLPAMNLQLPDSVTYFNTNDIPSGKPFIVIGFDPYCSHCQDLTADIEEHIRQFKDTHIYFITAEPYYKEGIFYRYYKLARFQNITVGRDTANLFFPYFKTSSIPYIAIFDAKKILKTVTVGKVTAIQLAQLIHD